MKRLGIILAALLVASSSYAQQIGITGPINSTSASCIFTACVVLPLANSAGAAIQLVGTVTGTFQFESTADNSTWAAIVGTPVAGGTTVTSATAAGLWQFGTAGMVAIRVRASAYTSGSITATIQPTDGPPAATQSVSISSTGLATSAIQTDGTQKGQICDAGGDCVTVTGSKLDVNASVDTTGLATSAKQDTGNTSLSSIDGKITAVNTGAVVITALTPGVAAGNLGKAEDAVAASGDTGVFILGVAQATPTATAADGDYIALKTNANGVLWNADIASYAQNSTTSGQTGQLMQGSVSTAAPTYNDAKTSPLSLDTAGSLRVAVVSGSTGNAAASNTGSAVPAQASYDGVNVGGTLRGLTAANPSGSIYAAQTDLASIAGTTADTNSGNKSAGTLRVVLATDQPALTAKLLVTPDANSAVNISQMNGVTVTMGNGASGTGVQRVTIANDSTGIIALTTGSAQIGHLEANQSSNVAQINGVTPLMGNGATGTGALRVSIANDSTGIVQAVTTAVTTNTAATCYLTSAATTNATNCKASAGNVYEIRAVNTTATLYYLRMYNSAGTPTCSSATGFIESIPIPSSTSGAGIVAPQAFGQAYSTGVAYCLTGGGSSTDNTSAGTGVYLTLLYR